MNTETLQTRLENPVERDPLDFGSREFWKSAYALAVRRWAEVTDENVRLRALVEWADTLLCNARPESHTSEDEWKQIVRNWRDEAHKPQCQR